MAQRNNQDVNRKRVHSTSDEEHSEAKRQLALTGMSEAEKIMKDVVRKIEDGANKPTDFLCLITSVIEQMGTIPKKTKVGVFGRSGDGKSYLINTILGERLLPSGTGKACTSVIIQVEANTQDSNFIAEIEFISQEDWMEELKHLHLILHEDHTEGDPTALESASEKISAVYGEDGTKKTLEELESDNTLSALIPEFLSSTKKIESHQTANNLAQVIRDYVRSGQPNSSGRIYWPLVKSVTIKVPGHNDILKNLVLIDLPGTGDIDMSRREMWKKCLRGCSTVWIISDINRAVSDQSAWEILTASTEDLIHGGECNNIAYICTKTDASIDPEEYMSDNDLTDEDLGITGTQRADHEKMKTRGCILHRNELSKKGIRHAFLKHKEIQDYFSDENFEVFTVSSKEFRKENFLSEKHTEVPDLIEQLRKLNANFPEKREEDYIKEALGVLSLIQGSNCDSHTNVEFSKMKDKACSRVKKQLEDQLDKLNHSLKDKYKYLDRLLSQGAKEAEQKCLQIAESEVINPHIETARGYHRTLRALCHKGGVTKSKSTKKITDLNGRLISPMHNLVNKAFDDLFERRSSRKCKSVAGILQDFNFTSGITNDFRPPLTLILNFLETQQNKLKTTLEEDIKQRKKEIYNCLKDTIELDMRPVYKKGESETGTGAFKRMQEVLRKGIEENKTSMFDQAAMKSLKNFDGMMAHIDKTLRKLADTAEDALSPKHSVPLPDITEEVNRMKKLRTSRRGRI
ncbi:nuclear GTPase SLIP-GC-like isoform X2 [Alosa sapidissima]|nr:nuclear GTPase SLIP-GC-like isoform X2 [Alosa sapidissima]XP_041938991.1 nuclear GTPase SLIP-GC-like isoform X2 [Alosa sapidissima]